VFLFIATDLPRPWKQWVGWGSAPGVQDPTSSTCASTLCSSLALPYVRQGTAVSSLVVSVLPAPLSPLTRMDWLCPFMRISLHAQQHARATSDRLRSTQRRSCTLGPTAPFLRPLFRPSVSGHPLDHPPCEEFVVLVKLHMQHSAQDLHPSSVAVPSSSSSVSDSLHQIPTLIAEPHL